VVEVIEEGISGTIVDDIEGAVDALAAIGAIDRRRCRAAFEARFTSARMARDYVRVYEALLAAREAQGLALKRRSLA
jgi:glycosyltransferase involved in cell wall biosynthesis